MKLKNSEKNENTIWNVIFILLAISLTLNLLSIILNHGII